MSVSNERVCYDLITIRISRFYIANSSTDALERTISRAKKKQRTKV